MIRRKLFPIASTLTKCTSKNLLPFSSSSPTSLSCLSRMSAVFAFQQRRNVTTYGDRLLSLTDISQKYAVSEQSPEWKRMTESPDLLSSEILPALEAVERQMMFWKLNRWEFRIPRLLSNNDQYVAQTLLERVKNEVLARQSLQKQIDSDLDTLSELLFKNDKDAQKQFSTREEMRDKLTREYIGEKVSSLRWEGETQAARVVRDAWLRLEKVGRRDHQLLERLCCAYGMAVLGSFDDAFANQIVADSATGEPSFTGFDRQRNSFAKLMQCVHTCFPTIDVMFGLMGYASVPDGSNNVPSEHEGHFGSVGLLGYRRSVGKYLVHALADRAEKVEGKKDIGAATAAGKRGARSPQLALTPSSFYVGNPAFDSKVLFASSASSSDATEDGGGVLLLDVASLGAARSAGSTAATGAQNPYLSSHDANSSGGNNNTLAGVSYCLVQNSRDVTLISISSNNKFKRATQLPPTTQMEGIARRCAMVFGLAMEDNIRVRNLLLPPKFMDASSLHRINKSCLGGHVPDDLKHWVEVYDKTVEDPQDADYAEDAAVGGGSRKRRVEDEWITL